MPQKEQSVVLIAAAPEQDSSYIKHIIVQQQQLGREVFIIAVDGGRYKAQQLGITPHIYIGDFDSSTDDFSGEKLMLPAEKDLSDTEAALEYALKKQPQYLFITGALGGRQDHCLCNGMALFDPQLVGIEAHLCDRQNIISVAKSKCFSVPQGFSYFSVIPVDEVLTGVDIIGAKYPLQNATLYRYKSLGLSNQAVEDTVTIHIGTGKGFLIFSKD